MKVLDLYNTLLDLNIHDVILCRDRNLKVIKDIKTVKDLLEHYQKRKVISFSFTNKVIIIDVKQEELK